MAIGNVSFMGTPYSAPRCYQPAFQQQSQQVDNQQTQKKKNNTSYLVGAAIVGLGILAILGYKGKLGEGIQKFLGGAEKSASKSSSATEGAASKTETTTVGSASKTGASAGERTGGSSSGTYSYEEGIGGLPERDLYAEHLANPSDRSNPFYSVYEDPYSPLNPNGIYASTSWV